MATTERALAAHSDWSALPDLALTAIALLLRTLPDFLAFGGVCRCWRLAAKAAERDFLSSLPPFLLTRRGFLCPTEGRRYRREDLGRRAAEGHTVIGFSHGHLILQSWQKPWLFNPVTGAEIWDFPCSPPNIHHAVLSSPPGSPHFALVVFGKVTVRYCRPKDRRWELLYDRVRSREWIGDVEDVAFVGGRGYLLCTSGMLATFDLAAAAGPELAVLVCTAEPIADWKELAERSKSLVEFKGQLFVFTWGARAAGDPVVFHLFQFDAENREWRRLESMGSWALFVNNGRGGAFVDNHAGWGGSEDAVYFLKQHYRAFSINIFHTDSGRIEPLFYHYCPGKNVADFDGIWVIPSLCV